MTLNTSPHHLSYEHTSLAAAIYFCSLCDKPFVNESSRRRHLRYCENRTRKRPRSCRGCNAAKVKCSFEIPCSRCTKKNIECLYDGATVVAKRASSKLSGAAQLSLDDGMLFNANAAFSTPLTMDDAQLQNFNSNNHPSVGLTMRTFEINESLVLDEFLAFEDDTLGDLQCFSDVSATPFKKMDQELPSWCTWTRDGVSLSVVTENPMAQLDSNLLAVMQIERPYAQHNANLVIQSLRSFPTMMLRKETFPWFIHPHSNLLSKSQRTILPEALSTCMSIAQIFTSRTSDTKPFLWGTVKAEYRRLIAGKYRMSLPEPLAATQACMIYLIMCIVDQCTESEEISLELLVTLHDLYVSFKETSKGATLQSELSSPSLNWVYWIGAESQRRLAHLWFLIGCVICIKTGIPCDPFQTYRFLPLPGLKSLWEATSQSAWEKEYEASHDLQTSGLTTLGDLIDAQKSGYSPSNAQKLDKWNAGVDNLGSLLNLVGTMV